MHERVTWVIVTPRKPKSIVAKPRLTLVSRGDNFPCYPLVQSIFIILKVNSKHRLHYVWFQNNPGQVNIWGCISYSVNSNAHPTPVRIYGEPCAHKFCTVVIILEYHPSSSNVTRCQVPSHVKAWFRDSAGDIDFYQMSQSDLTILHKIIISHNRGVPFPP